MDIIRQKINTGFNAGEFKKILDDNNLTTTSGHYDFHPFINKSDDELKQYVDQCIIGAHALNQKYITWPWLDPQSRTINKFKILAGKLNMIGEQTKAGAWIRLSLIMILIYRTRWENRL